jgi:iron complex transport system ATP-binding protein
MIDLRNLEIGYKAKNQNISVFKNIHLNLKSGNLVGLLGDNGIGKSTLLKTITGNLTPISGEVIINSQSIVNIPIQDLSKILSIVTTEKISGFNLTVWDVVASGRIPYLNLFGKLTPNDETIVLVSLEQLNLLSLKNKLMDELSDGQRQKVMVAKSLAQQTPIIILDEPTAFLDYTSKHHLFSILKTLSEEQNKLIIVSSHDVDLLKKYTTSSITLMGNNKIEITTI